MSTDEIIILSCAFRYALGRQTYVVGVVADELIRKYPDMPQDHRNRIASEIQDHQNEYGMAGSSFDNDDWNKVKWLYSPERHVMIEAQNVDTGEWTEHEAVLGDDGRHWLLGMSAYYHTVRPKQ